MVDKCGVRKIELSCYKNLGEVTESLGEYVKAKEYYIKALAIAEEDNDRETEATCYKRLGRVLQVVGEYSKAKEYNEKALAIAEKNGDKGTQAACYGCLGNEFQFIGSEDVQTGKEDLQTLPATAERLGDRKTASGEKLGDIFESLGADIRAKQYKDIKEGKGYSLLGACFALLGDSTKSNKYFEEALSLSRDTGDAEGESFCHYLMTFAMKEGGNRLEAKSHFFASIDKSARIQNFLQDHDQFKVLFFERFNKNYRQLSQLLCAFGNTHYEGLYMEEIGRARALADLMSSQYSLENEMSVNLQTWSDLEEIVKKERNCDCLYISYCGTFINLWVIKASKPLFFRRININDYISGEASSSKIDDFFSYGFYRQVNCFAPGECEDLAWFPSNACSEQACESSQGNTPTVSRLIEEEDCQEPHDTLADGYKMIIAPIAGGLDKPEIIIVPDRLFFKLPFAALKDKRGKYLSESFRLRITPSLTTLKLIQDSPADYHSKTGALIVGDPDVGVVFYKGEREWRWKLPSARQEAEMIGDLVGSQPLLGKQATKQTVLQNINSVSLIHFACHGDAERGEIILAPSPSCCNRIPQEEDYLLTMAEISQVRARAKLVVLSCCHSAKGPISSEGVVGIARAFLGSGARSVLVALWGIYDEETKQLMGRFYENLVRGESASESLHQAMKWMRENRFTEVKQWAPFILIGDNVTLDFHRLR